MIVNLPSGRFRATPHFLKEWDQVSLEARIQLIRIMERFLSGERLPSRHFKTFWIDEKSKILEFKVRDHHGNWRAISVHHDGSLVLIYAFHKKSQELQEREKRTIRARIRSMS